MVNLSTISVYNVCLQCGRPGFNPWVGKIPWRRKWQSTPVLLPGKSHGQRSLVGYSPWGFHCNYYFTLKLLSPLLIKKKLEDKTHIATSTTFMHIYGSCPTGFPQAMVTRGCLYRLHRKRHGTPHWRIVLRITLKKKGFFVPQRV